MAFLPEGVRPNGRNHIDLLKRCHLIKTGNKSLIAQLPSTVQNATSLMYHIGYVFPTEAHAFEADLVEHGDKWASSMGLTKQMLGFWLNRLRDGIRDGVRDAAGQTPRSPLLRRLGLDIRRRA